MPVLGGLLLLTSLLPGQALFVKPVKVLGDPHFIGTAANPTQYNSIGPNVVEGRELQNPQGIALDNSVSPPIVYIADTGNNRVLAFRYSTQLTAGSSADLILGQPDRFTTTAGGSGGGPSTSLRLPTGLAVDSSGNLYVADNGNNRVVRYPAPFAQASGYQFPDLIIGQTSFSVTSANQGSTAKATTLSFYSGSYAGHAGVAIDASGNLWVADINNNRVLRFPASSLKAQQFGPAADTVLGQPDLVTTKAATASRDKTTLAAPTGLAFDSKARLLVVDGLGRGLVYPAAPASATPALRILGVETNATAPDSVAINRSQGITFAGGQVVVMDTPDNRVLIFPPVDSWPAETTQFSPTANAVLGQSNFTAIQANQGLGVSSATTLSSPCDAVATATELFVTDSANNRVVVYTIQTQLTQTTFVPAASRVIGQLDFPDNAPNLVEGKEYNTITSSGIAGAAILDFTSTPPHLYVADTGNNRILGYKDFSKVQQGAVADIVIGQPSLTSTEINYPSGLATQPSAQGLNGPTSIVLDAAGNLYVADALNSRVLRFPAPFASGKISQEAADLVLGQSNFSAQVTTTSQATLSAPLALAFSSQGASATATSGWLAVADALQNRVLFFPRPFTSGMNASIVIGQPNFTSSTSGSNGSKLNLPEGVALDPQDRVIVADTNNARLQIYPTVGSLSATSTSSSISLTTNISAPSSIGMASGGDFWVADQSNNRVVHYPTIDQLPVETTPYTPDTSVPAVAPRSASPDQYGDLLVADGVNRILYFAPQIDVQNAANYLSSSVHALAPGTFTVIYPTVKTNVLSSGTQLNNTLPWPMVTSDTSVLINGTAAALYYVSPGQINFPMPMSAPSGGTVDLQVIRASTGQVYGGIEVPMATASPAMFVLGGQQSGPVASLNQDYSINSAAQPAARGTVLQIFGTGEGYVAGAPPEGQASSGPLASSVNPQVLLGPTGSNIFVPPGNIYYSGIAPGEVGVWQINVLIPQNSPTGNVPITLFMNSIPSSNQALPTQVVTTVYIQ